MNGLKDKTALLTGGAGFIGSELSRQVVDAGARLVMVDNLVNGKRENVADLVGDRVALEVVDIRDDLKLKDLMRGVDVVYHLACLGVRHSVHSPFENHEVNAEGTLKLLLRAREENVGRFVYVSTSEVYGTATCAPMPEDHPTYPHTVYGASKLAGECYARAYHDTYAFPTTVVRPFNSYGPRCHHEGDSGEVIPKFLLRALAERPLMIFGDGTQTRDFTYVEDTARGILMAGLADAALGQTINLGSGKEITINELARKVASLVNKTDVAIQHTDPRPGDVLRLCADSSRARALMGFQADVSLDAGLEKLNAWYDSMDVSVETLLEDERVKNWEADEA